LLVFGPRSLDYNFGPHHPLTPRRFGPGIDLLRAVGAEPGLAPEPAPDEELLRVHLPAYLETVRRFSADPGLPGAMGIGQSDNPAFAGMHEASAAVAAGSIGAIEAILQGRVEHAFHPGGGLHHAMASGASGFCIYNDPALAIARARADGLRVLYVDLDVHHGDGVQVLALGDPGVLTISIHESGRHLFPGTGFPHELGDGVAAGTSVNLPLEPSTGEAAWLDAVQALVPALAAVFGPDLVVSQHGADAHAWDPLAHLRVTTTSMGEAARLVDALAHRWAGGRWLATGGGGYDVYRVVPRTWSLVWLAGAHRGAPDATPAAWRERWEAEAAAYGTPGMPATFLDPPNAGEPVGRAQAAAEEVSRATLARVRRAVFPALVRQAVDRGWWQPDPPGSAVSAASATAPAPAPGWASGASGPEPIVRDLAAADLERLSLAPRTVAPFDPDDARRLLTAALLAGARAVGAVAGSTLVGVAIAAPAPRAVGQRASETLLTVGVAPAYRGRGLGRALLRELVDGRPLGTEMTARFGVAERDVVEPLDGTTRATIARRLLGAAGFRLERSSPDDLRDDPWVLNGRLDAA
jgi:acetoin utilization protein AcuC